MMRAKRLRGGLFLAFAAWLAGATPAWAADDLIAPDITRIMGWLSQEMAHGLAFNAGETFDPPKEIQGLALAPDMSLGAGVMPLDKSKFPVLESEDLKDIDISGIYPSHAMFPNMAVHMRAGLPLRSDFAVRFSNMTTPPGYKISSTAVGKGQSNSIGLGMRTHFMGGDLPKLAVGANYNYVFGRFQYFTTFDLNAPGFFAKNDVAGTIQWNVSSLGVNAVLSQNFGGWIPFAGLGYNYATGSVRSRLEVVSRTPLIPPVMGEASAHPEPNQARLILGTQVDISWMHFFINGEVKAAGVNAGKSWIVQGGAMLPFRIGSSADSRQAAAAKLPKPRPKAEDDLLPDMIFIQ